MKPLRRCAFLLVCCLSVLMTQASVWAAELPPVAAWGMSSEVDEPESAFHSLGRTMWHQGRNAERIAAFHQWLKTQGVEPVSLLPQGLITPTDARRALIEPERSPNCGWTATKEAIVSRPGHRGPEARLPLKVDRAGMYRLWIRHQGHAKGTAVTSLTLYRKGEEAGALVLYEEFNTQFAAEDGPRWHDLLTELAAGEYTVALGHVVRYYHTPTNVPFLEHKVDCLYLTDELWAAAPTEDVLTALRESSPDLQCNARPALTKADQDAWRLSQVRPSHWETARDNEPLFRLSYEFWREDIASIAGQNYTAPPLDPVRAGIAYEHIKDVSVFVLPSRHGPVATPAWESIREAVQHANLARMVRERAKPDDPDAKPLWETGIVEALRDWLLTHR